MKKSKLFLLFLIVINLLLYGVPLYHSYNSFQNLVLDRIDATQITSIRVLKSSNEQEIKVDDPKEIEKIIHEFSDVKLKRSDASERPAETYWIRIYVNKDHRFGMTLYGTDYLYFNDRSSNSKYHSGNFKITSKFDGESITSLFK